MPSIWTESPSPYAEVPRAWRDHDPRGRKRDKWGGEKVSEAERKALLLDERRSTIFF